MTILGKDKLKFREKFHHIILIVIVVSVAVIALNALLAIFRTDATHMAFLVINIVTDIALLWGILYTVLAVIIPRKKLLVLYERGENSGKCTTGKICEISDKTEVFQRFTCYSVTLEADGGNLEFYLIEGGIDLKIGFVYRLKTVENLIISAEESK